MAVCANTPPDAADTLHHGSDGLNGDELSMRSRELLFNQRRDERERLVKTNILPEGISDPRVIAAILRVPRHVFVPEPLQKDAYGDYPLPIGFGQTVSQPFIVAYMTERVRLTRQDRCLEIGTGSGYQAAILCELGVEVFSVEVVPELAERARAILSRLGYRVHQRVGDGAFGWDEHAPFDAIIVTAAPEVIPRRLLEQLKVGGRLIAPVGAQTGAQELELWTRKTEGSGVMAFTRESLLRVQFVPFVGAEVELERIDSPLSNCSNGASMNLSVTRNRGFF